MASDLRRPAAALDPGSFDRFYRRHLGEIYRYVLQDVGNRADAEEVTQNAFLDAFRALRRGHEPEMPRAWMYGIARNAARRRYRTLSRRPREVELEPALAEGLSEPQAGPWAEAIQAAFSKLRASHRDVLYLREVEGRTYAEIAARMDLSQSAVETLLFRARRALRELLEEEGIRPSVRPRRHQGAKALALLPGALLGRLTDRLQQLLAPELAAKTASAVTAVAVGTGVAVGTYQVLPDDAPARAGVAAAGPAPAAQPGASVPAPWLELEALFAPLQAAKAERRDKADRREAPGKDREARSGAANGGTGGADATQPAAGGSASVGGVNASVGGVGASVGGVSASVGGVPGASGGEVGVSTPPVSLPPVSTGPVSVPSVSTPPVSVPPVSTPSVNVPPIEAPDLPVAPAVSTPAVEVPSVGADVPIDPGALPGG